MLYLKCKTNKTNKTTTKVYHYFGYIGDSSLGLVHFSFFNDILHIGDSSLGQVIFRDARKRGHTSRTREAMETIPLKHVLHDEGR